jgi:acyl carrier protein
MSEPTNQSDADAKVIREIVHYAASINRVKSATINESSALIVELDFDSLQMLELFSSIERKFKVSLIDADVPISEMKTPGDIGRLVNRLRAAR